MTAYTLNINNVMLNMRKYWLLFISGLLGLVLWRATDPLQISEYVNDYYYGSADGPQSSEYDFVYMQQYPFRTIIFFLLVIITLWSFYKLISFIKQRSKNKISTGKERIIMFLLIVVFLLGSIFIEYTMFLLSFPPVNLLK